MINLGRYIVLFYLIELAVQKNYTGRWKVLFISKDGSNIEPYSLLMLNQSDSKTSFCSSDYQLYDEIQIDHCVTTDLINWHRNPPDKVALTYTNQYGELLNFMVYNNSEVKLNSTSRENWFDKSYLIESKYEYHPQHVLKSINRNFVNSQESSHLMDINSMSVGLKFTNYTKTKWYHITRANYRVFFWKRGIRIYRDTNNILHLPVTDCESSKNCLLCCSLLRKKMAIVLFEEEIGVESDTDEIFARYLYIKQRRKSKRRISVHDILQRRNEFGEYRRRTLFPSGKIPTFRTAFLSISLISSSVLSTLLLQVDCEYCTLGISICGNDVMIQDSNSTCYCVDNLPEAVADELSISASLNIDCTDQSKGPCYYIHEIRGQIISAVLASNLKEDEFSDYDVKTELNKTEIKVSSIWDSFNGITLVTLMFCPEWILRYTGVVASLTADKDSIADQQSEYVRIIEGKFSRNENDTLYTRLDFGPIATYEFTLQSLCGINLSRDARITKIHIQRSTIFYHEYDLRYISDVYVYGLIHAPYMIVKGYWYDDESTTQVSTIFTIPESSSIRNDISNENVTTKSLLREECFSTEAYSLEKNSQSYQCKCFPELNVTISAKLVEEIKDAISTNLSVKTNTLSSTTRTKISAQDDRSSSKTIGLLGSILLGLEFALLVFLDSAYIIQVVHNLYNKITHRHIGINEATQR